MIERGTRALSVALFIMVLLPVCAQSYDRGVGDLTRSDSIDILHTRIELDLTQVDNGIIAAKAILRFTPKVSGIMVLPLDLQLGVDSVKLNGAPRAFSHPGEELFVSLGSAFGPGDTLDVSVWYHGDPTVDASGWGGFYTLSSYQYDLGVAFDAVPHSYGRAWFPCFDNFIERCTFDFDVRTSNDRTVFCNGALVDTTDLGGGIHRTHWAIAEPIPSYLASVSSTNYVAVRDTFPSVAGRLVPVTLVAHPQDTTHMKASFIHLRNAFNTYENWYGPYRWERVGYCLTSQGAMEHPCNISYPADVVNGTLTYETTMAHELSHHWFGDLITCHRAEEMYINEGFAEYNSYLFTEALYGRVAYMNTVRSVHHTEVSTAHIIDGGWYALADMPENVTYGEQTYKKGAGVAHSLRSYLGDTLYNHGFKRLLANDAFRDMSTAQFRDSLVAATGVPLTDFFDDWILQPGWASFAVDSMEVTQNGNTYPTTVYVQQKLRHADHFYHNVPVSITFEDANGTRWTDPVPQMFGGGTSTAISAPPFAPVHAFLNDDERLMLASTVQRDTLIATGSHNLPLADMQLTVNTLPVHVPLRAEEIWTAADPASAFTASPDRWWRISGGFAPGTAISAAITVDGRGTSAHSFDPLLVQSAGTAFTEDSLVVLYRPDARSSWSVRPAAINYNGTNHTDGYAKLSFDSLTTGDYAIGLRGTPTGIATNAAVQEKWKLYPNPTRDRITVEAPSDFNDGEATLRVIDAEGAVVKEQRMMGRTATIDTLGLPAQLVRVQLLLRDGPTIDLGAVELTR